MEVAVTSLQGVSLIVILLGVLQFLLALWISERLKAALQRETGEVLERLRWDFKVREQGAKVAEYMALARNLREDSAEQDYRSANRLAWELAMWLPTDVYKVLGRALASPSEEANPLVVAIKVRKILLGSAAGDLVPNDIIQHAPGIGKRK
jgi:hypothetical protein